MIATVYVATACRAEGSSHTAALRYDSAFKLMLATCQMLVRALQGLRAYPTSKPRPARV